MTKVLVTESYLDDIADAIREKLGVDTLYKPSQMAAAIRSITEDLSNYYTKSEIDTMLALAKAWGSITGTLSDQTDLQNALNAKLSSSALLDLVYPVGSIYMSVNNVSPATFIGGTWSSFAAGRVLVGVDANDTDFDTVEETGGEKTHTLVSNELPNITGSIRFRRYGATDATRGASLGSDGVFSGAMETGSNSTAIQPNSTEYAASQRVSMSFGNDQAHNNLQPYITCYMWKRTA